MSPEVRSKQPGSLVYPQMNIASASRPHISAMHASPPIGQLSTMQQSQAETWAWQSAASTQEISWRKMQSGQPTSSGAPLRGVGSPFQQPLRHASPVMPSGHVETQSVL